MVPTRVFLPLTVANAAMTNEPLIAPRLIPATRIILAPGAATAAAGSAAAAGRIERPRAIGVTKLRSMLTQSCDVYGRSLPSSVNINGLSGVCTVSQLLGVTPGVGPWLSTEFVPGYSEINSSLEVLLCFFCHTQKA